MQVNIDWRLATEERGPAEVTISSCIWATISLTGYSRPVSFPVRCTFGPNGIGRLAMHHAQNVKSTCAADDF